MYLPSTNSPPKILICQPKYTRFSANSISLITKSGVFFRCAVQGACIYSVFKAR